MRYGCAGVDLDRRIVTFNRLEVPAYAVKDLALFEVCTGRLRIRADRCIVGVERLAGAAQCVIIVALVGVRIGCRPA